MKNRPIPGPPRKCPDGTIVESHIPCPPPVPRRCPNGEMIPNDTPCPAAAAAEPEPARPEPEPAAPAGQPAPPRYVPTWPCWGHRIELGKLCPLWPPAGGEWQPCPASPGVDTLDGVCPKP